MKIEDYEGIATATRARTSNVATITTGTPHGLITGDTITISGVGGTGYNDSDVTITMVDFVTFTYANTGSNEGSTGDTAGLVFFNFTFPHNPNVYDDTLNKFTDQRDYAYAFSYFGVTNTLKSKKSIIINGHFDGTTKNTEYASLFRMCNSNRIRKIYLGTDKFHIVFPIDCKKTNTGGRTNFIDYIASFVSPFGLLFDDTQKSGNASASDENQGDIFTPIEKITGTLTDTNLATIKDADGNGFTFTPTSASTLTIYLIKLLDIGSDNFFTEYIYAEIAGTRQVLTRATANKSMILGLETGESLNDLFSGGTVSANISSPLFFFRDGHSTD